VLTLPLIRLIGLVSETTKSEVFKIFKSDFRSERFTTLKNLLMEYGALDYAIGRARQFTDQAWLELSTFPDSPAKRSLERLLAYILERSR
jgi:octaprenyl-diphosphate synthase